MKNNLFVVVGRGHLLGMLEQLEEEAKHYTALKHITGHIKISIVFVELAKSKKEYKEMIEVESSTNTNNRLWR